MANERKDSARKRRTVGISESHFALAQQVAHVGSWELDLTNLEDLDSNPLRWSDETFRLLGFVPGEVEPSNELFFSAVHPEDRDRIRQAVSRAITESIPCNIEHRVIWPDGSLRILHELSTIVYGNNGKPQTMLGVVQDITHRKKIETGAEIPALLLRHIRDSVILCDLNGLITYWNEGAAQFFGYSQEDMLGAPISRLYPTRDVKELRSQLDQLLVGNDFDGEWEAIRRDGTRIWLHTRRTVLKNGDQKPIGFIGISKDITRQKREMEAVRQSEQLYRAVGESINFGVWSCDPKGRLTHLSDSFLKLLGLTHAQNLSDGWLNALHPDEREAIMQAWRECFRAGKPWRRRYRILGVDGIYHPVLTLAAPVLDDSGQVLCWAGLNIGIEQLT